MNVQAAQQVYEQSGLGPEDVPGDRAARLLLRQRAAAPTRRSGCAPRARRASSIDNGDTTYGGRWVVNPSGGLISKGHPLGATGLAQCAELTWQLRGAADKRQVDGRDRRAAAQHRTRRRRRRHRLPARRTLTDPTRGEHAMGKIEATRELPPPRRRCGRVVCDLASCGRVAHRPAQVWKGDRPPTLSEGAQLTAKMVMLGMAEHDHLDGRVEYDAAARLVLSGTGMAGVKVAVHPRPSSRPRAGRRCRRARRVRGRR